MTRTLIVEFEGAKFKAASINIHGQEGACEGCCFVAYHGNDETRCTTLNSSGASLCFSEKDALEFAGITYRDAIFKPHDDAARALLVARTLTK